MRIAYIANIRFPSERAHAVQIVSMANAFSSIGHQVTLHVTDRKTAISEEPEAYYGVRFLFRLMRVHIPDIVGSIHRFPKFLHPYLYSLERILFGLACARSVTCEEYDLVYSRDEWVLAIYALFRPKMRVVWESLEGKYSWPARYLMKRGKVVVLSDGILRSYVEHGHESDSFIVAHDAVDDRFFEPHIPKEDARHALGITDETRPIALYIGGFDRWKGVHTFFEAASHAPSVAFMAIGGKVEEIDGLVKQYPAVRFLGPRPYKELPQHQQAADVLVVPNTAKNAHSAEYTSPLKLFAHMTSNVPLVLSDIPSLRSVLTEDEAFYATPDDPQALAETILKASREATEAHRKAERALERSRAYTWKERASAIIKFVAE